MHNIFKKLPIIKTPSGITTAQMREVDRLMIEYYHINLVQMMVNAGRQLADIGVPRQLYKKMGLTSVIQFDNHPIVVIKNDQI